MKKQKGITLIALIITIIVMLILVGVTINVALNGGLFDKAKNASTKTQKEVDKEMLLSAVVATVDKYGNYHLDEVPQNLPEEEFTYNSTTKVYKSKIGNEFTINETTGKVEEYVAQAPSPNPEPVLNTKNLIPDEYQLADAGEPITDDEAIIYIFDEDGIVTYMETENGIKTAGISIGYDTYDWACNEETATNMGLDACCTWYKDGEVYNGPCPISLATLNEPKNANGYITDIINSFNN